MSLTVKTTNKIDDAADFVSSSILKQLRLGKTVLFFVAGGSAIPVAVKISQILREYPDKNLIKNLTVTLTDERYGPVGHFDSNWQQLLDKGFYLPSAKRIPVLTGDDFAAETEKFNKILHEKLMVGGEDEYRIGLFGIGADGHTAGILPGSLAVNAEGYAFGYKTEKFERITITLKTIEKLDEIIVWAQGKEKWKVIKNLLEENIDIVKQPAQILKKVPLLTIFTDYIKE